MTAHTPGPWSIERGQVRNAHGEALASVPYTLGGPEDAANGRLIAAAPELAYLLRTILDVWDDHHIIGPTVYHDARAILRTIDGEVNP